MPVRTLNAGPNRKYFNADRGVTYYNFTSDQFTGFHAIVIPGTLRDSMYILDGLLEHQTRLQPGEVMADTAGVSEVVFGLFWLLGYQFSPRMADIGKAKFWRLDPTADYGVLARARANTKLMTRNWDDLLRVAGSLHQHGQCVRAHALPPQEQTAFHAGTGHCGVGTHSQKPLYVIAWMMSSIDGAC